MSGLILRTSGVRQYENGALIASIFESKDERTAKRRLAPVVLYLSRLYAGEVAHTGYVPQGLMK